MNDKIDGRIAANKKRSKITDEQILDDIQSGLTRQEIADKHGVHVENLARRMRNLGVHAKSSPITPYRKGLADCWHYIESQDKRAKQNCRDFQYIESKRQKTRLKCKTCGNIIERDKSCLRGHVKCEYCKEQDILKEKRTELVRFLFVLKESKTSKVCSFCGAEYYSQYVSSVYCSDKCKKKAKRTRRKERDPEGYALLRKKHSNHAYRYIDRAKKYGCAYEYGITLKSVVNRDGLVCKICGKPCDFGDRSYGNGVGPLYPSIDHIIPLSKGGSHTWDNVQIVHCICNSVKRDLYTVKREEVWT